MEERRDCSKAYRGLSQEWTFRQRIRLPPRRPAWRPLRESFQFRLDDQTSCSPPTIKLTSVEGLEDSHTLEASEFVGAGGKVIAGIEFTRMEVSRPTGWRRNEREPHEPCICRRFFPTAGRRPSHYSPPLLTQGRLQSHRVREQEWKDRRSLSHRQEARQPDRKNSDSPPRERLDARREKAGHGHCEEE